MSRGVVAAPAASTLIQGWNVINGCSCPDAGLRTGSCCAVVEIDSSSNSSGPIYLGTADLNVKPSAEDEVCSVFTVEQDSTSSPSVHANDDRIHSLRTSPGLQRMGSDISTLSTCSENHNNGKHGPKEVCNKVGKLSSSQYKGVVPQPNGRWGAQIYEKHQRVWLGTFNIEREAATAYDRAVAKLRGRDAITNFAPLPEIHPESAFLRRHSKGEIVEMLRKHIYEEELDQATNAEAKISLTPDPASNPTGADATAPHEHLFDKAVTPSDVGKLNRLVIPKQHAEKYFPLDVTASSKGILLNFEDSSAKTWRFRYSYWNSSQSYVLTKGWSRYVKEKRLQAGDVVTFERSAWGSGQVYITFCRRPCNVMVTDPLKRAASSALLRSPQFGSPIASYRQWAQALSSLPSPVPWAAPPNYSPHHSIQTTSLSLARPTSDDGNPLGMEFVNMQTEMLFGVNLKPSTLNLFPSSASE